MSFLVTYIGSSMQWIFEILIQKELYNSSWVPKYVIERLKYYIQTPKQNIHHPTVIVNSQAVGFTKSKNINKICASIASGIILCMLTLRWEGYF